MKAVVVESNDTYFEAGEEFEIFEVDRYRNGLPEYFDIEILDGRFGGRTLVYCKQNGCYHLNGGKWAFMPDD